MQINYLYQLHWANKISRNKAATAILDYGCGSGEVIIEGRKSGLNIYGADVFYEGGNTIQTVEHSGLLGNTIRKIEGGKLDFDDDYFTLVMSNQVMEHVEDMDTVLMEIFRVMKPGGLFLSLFPIRETMRENHIGIPFVHWLPRNGTLRYVYTLTMRFFGFGNFKADMPVKRWTKEQLKWLDSYTVYRNKSEILELFKHYFTVNLIEDDFMRFRLAQSSIRIEKIYDLFINKALGKSIIKLIYHRLGGMVLLCVKE